MANPAMPLAEYHNLRHTSRYVVVLSELGDSDTEVVQEYSYNEFLLTMRQLGFDTRQTSNFIDRMLLEDEAISSYLGDFLEVHMEIAP